MKKTIFVTATVLMSCFGVASLTLGAGQDPRPDQSTTIGPGMESSGRDSSGMATTHQQKYATSLKANQVRELQKLLKEEGYEVGNVDGIIGPRTAGAIRQYQNDRNLDGSGIPDEKTLRSLAPDRKQQEFFGLAPEFGEKEGMKPEKQDMTPEKQGVTPDRQGLTPDTKKLDSEPTKKGY